MSSSTAVPNTLTTIERQAILGMVAAAPNGITTETISHITARPGLSPALISRRLTAYQRSGHIELNDGRWTPTPRLFKERDTWDTDKPQQPAAPPRNAQLPPEVGDTAANLFNTTTLTLHQIAEAVGCAESTVRILLKQRISEDDWMRRQDERAAERLQTVAQCERCGRGMGGRSINKKVCGLCLKRDRENARRRATMIQCDTCGGRKSPEAKQCRSCHSRAVGFGRGK